MNATDPRLYQPQSRRGTPTIPTQLGDTHQPKPCREIPPTQTKFGGTSNTVSHQSWCKNHVTDKINSNPDSTTKNSMPQEQYTNINTKEEKAQLQRELAALHRQVAHVFERLAALEAEGEEDVEDARSTAE
ncbi:MAG: hypothetical protein Q9221_000692 [Calogaya cf. arnoldii]